MQNISPPDLYSFSQQVWSFVRQVPYGKVVTYGQIAQMISLPAGVEPDIYKTYGPRWVGDAMAACPDDVPWQRVINAQGKISDRRGAMKQKRLLEEEGVVFVNNKLDMKVCQWRGSDQDSQDGEAELRQGSLF